MNRQELAESTQRQTRRLTRALAVALLFFLVAMIGLVVFGRTVDRYVAGARYDVLLILAGAVPVIALVTLAVVGFRSLPKCPHCGVRLVSWLLATAVATGNCGRCGRSIES
jgi:hypothetical protein